MVIGNTLQNIKNTVEYYTRSRAENSQNPAQRLKRTRSAEHDETDDPEIMHVFHSNAQLPNQNSRRTVRNLRDRSFQPESQAQRRQGHSLESSLKSAQNNAKQLRNSNLRLKTELFNVKMELSDVRAELKKAEENTFEMIENHKQTWALKNNIVFPQTTQKSVPQLLDDLLRSTRLYVNLRQESKALESDIQARVEEAGVARRAELDANLQAKASQAQVHVLQQQLLAQIDNGSAISDDKFSQDFRCLTSLIKSLSRSMHITKDTDILPTLGTGYLLQDVEVKHWDTRARKKALAEAWIWSVLVEMIFSSPFALSEEHGGTMADLWYRLFGTGHDHDWPTPTMVCEKWRYSTMEHAMRVFGLANSMSNDQEGDGMVQDDDLASLFYEQPSSSKVRNRTIDIISTKLATVSYQGHFAQIPGIVDRAMILALDMSLQRCRLQVTYPAVNSSFVESQMCTVVDTNGKDIEDGTVAFIVHPGLTKWGDANGKDLDQRYDIVPAFVQLQPPKPHASGEDCQERNII